MRLSSLLFCLSLISVSCVESFIPETTSYDDMLFIEARVTNDDQLPPGVSISRTTPIGGDQNSGDRRPVSGADVYIICDDGSEYPFYESLSGEYIPVDEYFTGETGKSYKLILYHGENTYESNFEKLLYSPSIDSINAVPTKQKISETGDLVDGLQFFISTQNDSPSPSYYRWILDATFMYDVPHRSSHIYDGYDPVLHTNRDVIYCWKSIDISGIFISGTEGLIENAVVNEPLNFVDQYGDDLCLKYSLHARQLTISRQAYEFWSDLDKLTNQMGGLYESQPFRLEGNIRCTTNPSLNVTGILEVAGVSEGREFFLRPTEFEILRLVCEQEQVGSETLPWSKLPVGTYLYEEEPGVFFTADTECFDCRSRGGTTDRPVYWE
ncbi:MAG: DUF4249 domain-containing protein [Bacteroidota bacterium]